MKKKILALLLSLIMIVSVMPMSVFAVEGGEQPSWTGSGTEGDPYVIADIGGLEKLANEVNDGKNYDGVYFKLADGFDNADNPLTTPIGTSNLAFAGNFDGNDRTVYLEMSGSSYLGLFGYVDGGTTIKNVTVAGNVTGEMNFGGVCGQFNSWCTITNCVNNAAISGTSTEFGGICGVVTMGTVDNCTNNGSVTGNGGSGFGGIVGCTWDVVTNCTNNGAVTGRTCGQLFGPKHISRFLGAEAKQAPPKAACS